MNTAHSGERDTPSTAEASDAVSTSGRVASVMGVQTAAIGPPLTTHASFPPARSPGMMVHRNNSISLTTAVRKRPRDALSPLPSPLLTFLSSAVAASPALPASLPPLTMNQLDLASVTTGGASRVATNRELQATAVGHNSLKFVVPSGIKRVRREAPTSPCSVGEVSSTTTTAAKASTARPSPALPPVVPPPASSDKIRSVVRGLEHVSRCSPSGCGNPLCLSTRGFMNKVSAHLVAMANKPGHVADRCGACQLWNSIVRSHASICMEVNCSIPLCGSAHENAEASSTYCCPRDRRDDKDDNRHSLVAQQ